MLSPVQPPPPAPPGGYSPPPPSPVCPLDPNATPPRVDNCTWIASFQASANAYLYVYNDADFLNQFSQHHELPMYNNSLCDEAGGTATWVILYAFDLAHQHKKVEVPFVCPEGTDTTDCCGVTYDPNSRRLSEWPGSVASTEPPTGIEPPTAIELPLRPRLVKQIMSDPRVTGVHIPEPIHDAFVAMAMATEMEPSNATDALTPNLALASCMPTTGKTATTSCHAFASQSECDNGYNDVLPERLASACRWDPAAGAGVGACARVNTYQELC